MVATSEPSVATSVVVLLTVVSVVGYGVSWLYERAYRESADAHLRAQGENLIAVAHWRAGRAGRRLFFWLGAGVLVTTVVRAAIG